MAITQSDFKQIPSSGEIPDDRVPASAFAVGFVFTYYGTPSLDTFNHTFSGKIVLHVMDASDAVKYVIEIEETYNLFIFPLAPGLVLYTWNWVPTAEKISGRKGEAEDAEPMTTLGLGTFGVDPAEDSGTTNREVIVDSAFYSGLFTEPLESGDKLVIKFHNLSAGFVVREASLLLATELGGGLLRSLFHADTGQTFLLHLEDGALKLSRTRRMQPTMALREDDDTVPPTVCDYEADVLEKSGSLTTRWGDLHRHSGVLYCPAWQGNFIKLLASTDDGKGWWEVARIAQIELNMTVLASAIDDKGAVLYLYGTAAAAEDGIEKGAPLYAEIKNEGTRNGTPSWKLSARGAVSGDELPTRDVAGLEYSGGTLRLIGSGKNALNVWFSRDGLRTLERLALS